MHRATIRFYAELNDFLAPEQRARALEHRFYLPAPVKDVIEGFGVPHTEVDLILVNGESVDFRHPVQPGDRVSVYPMFESLDIKPVLRVRPAPLREPRFVLDGHLGRLARYLRMLGFDAEYRPKAEDAELAAVSSGEQRILLTRDRGLLKRSAVTHGYCVRETAPRQQLAEVVRRFDLAGAAKPFTRCIPCNGRLVEADREAARNRLPEGLGSRHERFHACEDCGRLYWEGSHHRRMKLLLEAVLREAGGGAA